jgi:hypothetical protein
VTAVAARGTICESPGRGAGCGLIHLEGVLLKKVLLALSVAAVLSFAASASASSPSAYRAQVNGICAVGIKQLTAIPQPKKPSGYYAYFKTVASMSDKLLAKVSAVKPPSSLAGKVATAVSRQGAFEAALHTLVSKLKTSSNPQKTVHSAASHLNSLNSKANAAWRAAGLLKCAG